MWPVPLKTYDRFFGGKGGAAKAHRAMVAKYGARADAVFYGLMNKRKKKYGAATRRMREAILALPDPSPQITQDAALLEDLYVRGFAAIQDGDLSFETVTAAVQQAITEMHQPPANEMAKRCTVIATFLGSAVYEEDGKLFSIAYRMDGTDAILDGEPEEVTAEFHPAAATVAEAVGAPLIEARPAGTLRPGQINRDLNVIENTVLITAHSANGGKGGRRYSDDALRKIAAMAEGLPAYLNHVPADQAFKPRDVKDLIGVHRNVRLHPTEGKIYSDLHVASHQAPLVFGLAETFGHHIGNSLVSRGLIAMEGDTEVVKDIVAVRSADLVSDPATTKGLFEARADVAPNDPDPLGTIIRTLRETLTTPPKEEASMDFAAIVTFLKDKPDQQAVLAEHLGYLPKQAAETLRAQVATVTAEKDALTGKLREIEAVAAKATGDLQEAKVALDGYKAKDAIAEKRARLARVISEHALGKQFGTVPEAVSDTLREQMEALEETKWTAVLDDRLALLKSVPGKPTPTSGLKPEDLSEAKAGDDKPLPTGIHGRLIAALRN